MDNIRELSGKDLNLLTVFLAIDQTRNVTGAAKLLGMSQPAVSHALSRLRDMLGDQLFTRTPKGMVPTPAAERIAPSVKSLLNRVRLEVFAADDFDPASLKWVFHLKTTDFIEALLLPGILPILREKSPHAQVKATTAGFGLPKDSLGSGECDLAIAGFFGDLPVGFYQQRLFQDDFTCCVRKSHARLSRKSKMTIEDFTRERHALIAPGGELTSKLDNILGKRSARFIEVGLSSFMASGWVVSQTDTVLTAPRRLVQLLVDTFDVKSLDCPVNLPKISIVQVWHERNHEDKAHQWFRSLVRQTLQV